MHLNNVDSRQVQHNSYASLLKWGTKAQGSASRLQCGMCCDAGPSPCLMGPIVVRGGKTQENGKLEYMGMIRARWAPLLLPAICCMFFCEQSLKGISTFGKQKTGCWTLSLIWLSFDAHCILAHSISNMHTCKHSSKLERFIEHMRKSVRGLSSCID